VGGATGAAAGYYREEKRDVTDYDADPEGDDGTDRVPPAPAGAHRAGGSEPPEAGLTVLAVTVALARVMDALSPALVLCTPAGSILHANHSAQKWLDAGGHRAEIEEEIRYVCVGLHLQIVEEEFAGEGADAAAVAERRVMLDGSVVRLRAVDLGIPRHGRTPASLVLLDPREFPLDLELEQVGLTRAEIRIARLVMRGRTNAEIARTLSVSIHTVRHHVQHIYDKVGVRSRTHLVETLRLPGPESP
jgi:DNA-binding CsgD family transcriptional regulator